ncbi:MAG TPA: hypothetical protein VL197_05440 [Nitrospirota bacterium]|nr:hypothetical protein [Nitrospirota bacterium]
MLAQPVKRRRGRISAFIAAMLLASCMTMPQGQVRRFIDMPDQKVLLVGKVAISPPLQPREQMLKTSLGERFRNKLLLYCAAQFRDFRTSRPDAYEGSYEVTPDETFYIEVNKGTTIYVSGVLFYTEFDPPYSIVSHVYPGLSRVEISSDDEAVYVGTIQFSRDEHDDLVLMAIRDDYRGAEQEFKERFTTSTTLRKALLEPVSIGK